MFCSCNSECKMCSTKNKVECHNKCSVPRKRQNKGLHSKFLDFAFKACPKCIQKKMMKSFISYFYNTRATETTKKGLISEFDKYHSVSQTKFGKFYNTEWLYKVTTDSHRCRHQASTARPLILAA